MAAKVIRDPRLRARAEESRRKRKGKAGRPLSGAEAAAEGATTTVVCEAPATEKKKFPLVPVLITGFVTAVGGIFAYRGYQKFFAEKKEEERAPTSPISGASLNPSQQRVMDARNALLLSAPTAVQAAQVQAQAAMMANPHMMAAAMPQEQQMVVAPPAPRTDPDEVLSYMDAYVQQFDDE